MKKQRLIVSACIAALVCGFAAPAFADSPGLIWAVVKSKLIGLGVLSADGSYTPAGSSLQAAYDGGNTIAATNPITVTSSHATNNAINVTSSGGGIPISASDTSAGGASAVAGASQHGRAGYFSRSFSSTYPVVQLVMSSDIGGFGLHVAGGSQATNAPVFAATQTWNGGAQTFKGILFDVTPSAYAAASRLFDLQVSSTSMFSVDVGGRWNAGYSGASDGSCIVQQNALTVGPGRYVMSLFDGTASYAQGTGSGVVFGSKTDGTNLAQNGAIYSSKTNGTSGNHSSDIAVATNNGGGSILEAIRWTSAQHTQIPSGSVYSFSSSSTNAAAADAGISRVSAGVMAAGNGTAGNAAGTLQLTTLAPVSAGTIAWASRSVMSSPADGQILLTNAAGTDFSRIMFGGTTDSFPALRRSGADLHIITGAAGSFSNLIASGLSVNATTPVAGCVAFTERSDPSAGAADTALLYTRDNGAGKTQLVVRFNSGAVQVIATEP